jgi:hypothetical protein
VQRGRIGDHAVQIEDRRPEAVDGKIDAFGWVSDDGLLSQRMRPRRIVPLPAWGNEAGGRIAIDDVDPVGAQPPIPESNLLWKR